MNIKHQNQYNQSISRYKLLSGTAGVGSIVTSTLGYSILIANIDQWEFIRSANSRIKVTVDDPDILPEDRYRKVQKEITNYLGLELINDERFIELLKTDKELPSLICLAAIPHLSLNDTFNSINVKDNPIIKKLKSRGVEKNSLDFAIPGTHFPKWFRNDKGQLKQYEHWKKDWKNAGKELQYFAPPKDANSPIKRKSTKNEDIEFYPELTQLNLILICENGHLSDIPWSHYLRWRTKHKAKEESNGEHLFFNIGPCCDHPELRWSENKNSSEGYASIFIECKNCKMGSGDPDSPKINLQGINNLRPHCPGHKPWEISIENGFESIPFDKDCITNGVRTQMQIALVTGNSVYFANTFNSVYIPIELVKGINQDMHRMLSICNTRYSYVKDTIGREAYADRKIDELLLIENGLKSTNVSEFVEKLKALFIQSGYPSTEEGDLHEIYRLQEYNVFSKTDVCKEEGLSFEEMKIPIYLSQYFRKIKKIDELKVTSVQLDFTRVRPKERLRDINGNIIKGIGKNIFSTTNEQVLIMPAVENFGEGIFFEFNDDAVNNWMNQYSSILEERITPLLPRSGNFNGNALRQKVERDRSKFLLIHSFSHLIMRELEFSCGYPTASLKERLYISPEMSGVLIYTAEGSEGSMGGLIWQVQPDIMEKLIRKALLRATDCSSDPLCWSSDGQGVFELNLASCFSCSLISETACEERNLGLDRRMLIDPNFGFFQNF